MTDQFWQTTPLDQLSTAQWESLCDRCGLCCLVKLEDEDTGEVHYTDLACRYLNCDTAQCQDYAHRTANVPACLTLTPANLPQCTWLPVTCAYRRIYEGRPLPRWHPLISGRADGARRAGVGAAGRVRPETAVPEDEWETCTVRWVQV